MNVTEWTPIIVAAMSVVGGAGFWGWMQYRAKSAHEFALAQAADSTEFREGLKFEVKRLREKVKQLESDKHALEREMAQLEAVADIQIKLAAQDVTIRHLENELLQKKGETNATEN